MFERHEKWFVLGIIALAIWYFYKKGKTVQAASLPYSIVSSSPDYANLPLGNAPGTSANFGSIVNPVSEPGAIQPAQSSGPVIFRPAQPSTVPISQRISAGTFQYYPAPPVLRATPLMDANPRYLA